MRIARAAIERRRDVQTLDAYAWALNANGQVTEARREIEAVLEVGIHDARVFYHAGVIAAGAGDTQVARTYFSKAVQTNPQSRWAAAASDCLSGLGGV